MHTLMELGKGRHLNSKRAGQHVQKPRWLFAGKKLKVNIVAMGDVGATTLMGLKLLGGDVISRIGITDLNEHVLKRYEMEMNQVFYPWDYDKLPEVKILKEEEIFDCDVFIFCATKGVAPVGSQVHDVRMQQLKANREIIGIYARKARECEYKGLFAVVSDPVEPLCNAAWYMSNCNYLDEFDDNGLSQEQVQGFGLGVMNARAAYYAKRDDKYKAFLKEGRVFGPHGKYLVVADSLTKYNNDNSIELSELASNANMCVRELGYKPYIAPALSSAAISILLTMRGEYHYGSVSINEIYFGCRNRYTPNGLEIELLELPDQLYERIHMSYNKLEEISQS